MTRLRAIWEYLRGTYWAVPSTMALGAAGLAFGMVRLDEVATGEFIDRLEWVYTGGPDGAREMLSTIAGSMITVAGVAFSITIVALTLASQQFGPRLLRNFLRDMGNQVVLGTFVSTFLYCLLVLRTVRGHDDTEFVPHMAVTGGVLLATLSLGVLIYFIHHVSTSIQATRIIAHVAADLDAAIDSLFPTFFIDQLVELAVRALSPGINDPETARNCIDRLEHAVCRVAGRQPTSSVRYDRDGQVRVLSPPVTLEAIAASAFEEIGRYGRSSVSVTCRLLAAVGGVGECVTRETERQALARLARDIAHRAGMSEFSDRDRRRIDELLGATMEALRQ